MPEIAELQEQAGELTTRVRSLEIRSAEDAEKAAGLLTMIVAMRRQIKEEFDPMIKSAREALQRVRDSYEKHDSALEAAERTLRTKLAEFREQEARRLEEEARRRAEEERARIEERTEAILDSLDPEVANPQLIEAICDQADREIQQVATMVAAPPKPAINGASFRETWKAEVVDLIAVARAVAAGKAPKALLQVNMTEANRLAAAHREELGKFIPGLVARKQIVTVTRRGGLR
jgi:hypothetical protein